MDISAVDRDTGRRSSRLKGVVSGVLICALAFLCLLVLRPFFSPILWAGILAYATWPLYRRLQAARLGSHPNLIAALMTLLVAIVAVVPVLGILILAQHELADGYRSVAAMLARGSHSLPARVRDFPVLGPWLQDAFERYSRDPASLAREVSSALPHWGSQLAAILGSVGRGVGRLLIALLTLFFFYRDGDSIARQMRRVIARFLGNRMDRPIAAAGAMTRAVIYGFLVTAVFQGLIAGIGYGIFGVEAPVLLGILTGALSAAPVMGTALVWIPVATGLLLAGHYWKGSLLTLWCSLLVHPVDNLLRPILISGATRVPFLLVMFGVIGGLAAFGFVGLVVGPVLLGVAVAVWNEWAADGDVPGSP